MKTIFNNKQERTVYENFFKVKSPPPSFEKEGAIRNFQNPAKFSIMKAWN